MLLQQASYTPSFGGFGINLRLVNLPGYSPDFNAHEAIWDWAREEATGNLCLGNKEAVWERVRGFPTGLTIRKKR